MTEFIGVPTTMTLGLIGESLAGLLAKKVLPSIKMPVPFFLF